MTQNISESGNVNKHIRNDPIVRSASKKPWRSSVSAVGKRKSHLDDDEDDEGRDEHGRDEHGIGRSKNILKETFKGKCEYRLRDP